MTRTVAVMGYGPVGRALVPLLIARGDLVRVVQRHSPAALPQGCDFRSADVTDRAAVTQACAGTNAVVCCIGVPYISSVYERVWPLVMASLLDACASCSIPFIFADNLYMYGPQSVPLTEELPLTTFGRKPRVRAEITTMWLDAHARGRVRAVAVRASDFYGPDCETSVISRFGVARLIAGQAAIAPYQPDNLHDFTYVPDFARALVTLLDAPADAYGQAWHVPNAPTRTLRDILGLAARLIGVPLRVRVLSGPLVGLLGLVRSDVRELREMRFQWDGPYLVDASKFRARFWSDPTPFEAGLRATIASYRDGKDAA
jgi:nucleoside-diphosphate-sugar epimerase